jgi:glycosyltransferase involved in cell wall biosynthesis
MSGAPVPCNPVPVMVSCLMVTLPTAYRAQLLRRSMAAYCQQTHAALELVIVVDTAGRSEASDVLAMVAALGRQDIRVVLPERKLSLGALRNLSWREARGDVICQWDDDDLSHPQRVSLQLEALLASGRPACYLQEFMQYFPTERRLYRVNFRVSPDRVAVNTLMCRRDLAVAYPEAGPNAARGEDAALVQQIRDSGGYHALEGMAHLFVYVSHGRNTWEDGHHRMLVDKMGVSKGLLHRSEEALRAGLAPFDFGGQDVVVTGRNGDAFTLTAASRV